MTARHVRPACPQRPDRVSRAVLLMGVVLGPLLGLLCVPFAPVCYGQEVLPDGTRPAQQQIAGLRVAQGLVAELFAAEPQLSGPVAICLDEQGRVYVAEEYRFNRGTEENRTRPFFLDDDLQIKTLEDRLAMFRKYADRFEGGMDWFSKVSDQVRILEDRDGDGRADISQVFAGGFNDPLDGLAAGVIARDGDVYLTCIPHLWRLRDTDGDGKADVREPLLRGFGVNCAFLGHDLHGLAWGPDGRLYFSVGDRGFHVKTKEGAVLSGPRRGAAFRCDADGSNLELIHVGMRNPQELAFDEFGNLFAADNNCDKGDLSRLVYVVEGGDSGWNMAYQTMADPYLTGPWHAEQMWHVESQDQPAWIVPPVGALGAGPSGFAYYPGTGLDARYQGHFFLCNYTGNGGIESFAVKPHGAGFRITDEHDFLKPIQATDVDFGYDGKMYVSDFVNLDWTGKSLGGRIYTVFDPAYVAGEQARQTSDLFRQGFRQLSASRLLELLEHPDMRVRLRAQYEIVRRAESKNTPETIDQLGGLAKSPTAAPPARRHAVWALWQLGRHDQRVRPALRGLLDSGDDDIRLQATRVLGDLRDMTSADALAGLLRDPSPRVRFMAALSLGRLGSTAGNRERVGAVTRMLIENADADAYLRHAGVMALLGIADEQALAELAKSSDRSVRLATVLVRRRRPHTALIDFLQDSDPAIVTEAARAINDQALDDPAPDGTSAKDSTNLSKDGEPGRYELALADTVQRLGTLAEVPDALARRVIHANFRLGRAERLLELAMSQYVSPAMRQEAMDCVGAWSTGANRDRVNGNWRPVPARDATELKALLEGPWQERLLTRADGPLLVAVIDLLARYDIAVDNQRIAAWARDEARGLETRERCLSLLVQRKSPDAAATIDAFLGSTHADLRAAGRQQLARQAPTTAVTRIREAIDRGAMTVLELQSAFQVLATIGSPAADAVILDALQQQVVTATAPESTADVPSAIALDVLAAAEARNANRAIAVQLDAYRARLREVLKTDPLAEYRVAVQGGNALRGEQLFRTHRQAQCLRCHKVRGGGGTAGPDLSTVATRADRQYLLESIVLPDAKIAKGFATVTLVTDAGRVLGGVVRQEDDQWLVLETPQGQTERIAIDSIE
jgi:quinoprotein glucose dehydrogenase